MNFAGGKKKAPKRREPLGSRRFGAMPSGRPEGDGVAPLIHSCSSWIIIVRISRVKNLHRVASSLEHCRFRAFSIVKARVKETDFFSELVSRFNDFRLLIFQPHLCSLQFDLRGLQRNREDVVLRVGVHGCESFLSKAPFERAQDHV